MIFDSESEDECMMFDEELQKSVPVTKEKKCWKKLYDIVMDRRTDIPLK